MRTELDDRLFAVYERLAAAVEPGPVMHRAEVDGWSLWMATSDWGELTVSARQEGRIVGFTEWKDGWDATYHGTSRVDLGWFVPLAEKAVWEDAMVSRRKRED